MQKNQALNILNKIKQATFENAAPLPLRENAQPEWQGMGFQVGGVRLVTEMDEISEVMKVPRLATLPSVKPWLLGISNVRGRLVPVVDLHDYLGMTPTLPVSQWRVLVIEDDDLVSGLLVEQSLGMQHFHSDALEKTTTQLADSLQPYIRGAYRHGGRVYYAARLKSILRDEKFMDVAERNK